MPAERKCLLKPGTILNDKWMIMDLIGKGAMGEVYRAHQLNLQRDVAIKIISGEWFQTAEGEAKESENIIQRFRREFQAMAQVRHPNVLQIFLSVHSPVTLEQALELLKNEEFDLILSEPHNKAILRPKTLSKEVNQDFSH